MSFKKYLNYYLALNKGELFGRGIRAVEKRIKTQKLPNIPIELEHQFEISNEELEIPLLDEIQIFDKVIPKTSIDWYLGEQKSIKYWMKENISEYSDVKYIWEINRLQFIFSLNLKNDEKIQLVKKWFKENPFDIGINWNSNLEVAIRSISLVLNSTIFKSNKEIYFLKELLFLHAYHLEKDLWYTERCIPNNHLIGEAAALYCLSFTLESNDSIKWRKRSKSILKKYIYHFRSDGTYKEASLSYHRFALQMYIMVLIFSKKFDDNFITKEIEEVLKKSYVFFKSIRKPNNTYPDFGDNDNGYYYQIKYQESFHEFVRSIGTLLSDDDYFGNIQLLEKMFNQRLKIDSNQVDVKEQKFFSSGKYVVVKDDKNYIFINNQDQIHHSHSDGMNIELMIDGKEVLTDSGTFSYNLDLEKRGYYRGTRSHNTVWMSENQTLSIGSFRWIKKAKNNIEFFENDFEYIVTGIIKTRNSNEFTRRIIINKNNFDVYIKDTIKSYKISEVNYNFSENVEIKNMGNKYYALINNLKILIDISENTLKEIKSTTFSKSYGSERRRKTLRIVPEKYRKMVVVTVNFKRS